MGKTLLGMQVAYPEQLGLAPLCSRLPVALFAVTYTDVARSVVPCCRMYAGVHFPFDVIDGRIVGNQVRSG